MILMPSERLRCECGPPSRNRPRHAIRGIYYFDPAFPPRIGNRARPALRVLDDAPRPGAAFSRDTGVSRVLRQGRRRSFGGLRFTAGGHRLFHLAGAVDVVVLAAHAAGL
jgi:hypothetical protein